MAETHDFKDLIDATEPNDNSAPSTSADTPLSADKPLGDLGEDKPLNQDEPERADPAPDTTTSGAADPTAPTPSSPSNPPPNIPGKLPEHGVENENEDVVQDATQKQFVHQALVYVLRAAKELATNVKSANTNYSQVAVELESFLNGFVGRVESVQSDVPQAAGVGAGHGDPGQNSHVKI